jgi:hypothetical protein
MPSSLMPCFGLFLTPEREKILITSNIILFETLYSRYALLIFLGYLHMFLKKYVIVALSKIFISEVKNDSIQSRCNSE